MFLGDFAHRPYDYPWTQPFERRFAQLISRPRRIAYYYTQPDNSTFRYRCYNMVEAIMRGAQDASACWFRQSDGRDLARVVDVADVLVLGRVQYDTDVGDLIKNARKRGVRVLFDVDDLVFDPSCIELLMSSLAQDMGPTGPWDYWYAYVGRLSDTLRRCDAAITTNAFLAAQIEQRAGLPAAVAPNFLNADQLAVSEAAWNAKADNGWARDGRIHIGYFSGSPSHARDLAIVAPTLAGLLDADRSVHVHLAGYIDPNSELAKRRDRVEVLPFTDYVNLQRMIAATEINIAPLQENTFTNCKSELKYFEAAIVGTITVASPTIVFSQAIADGATGFLANELQWGEKLDSAMELVAEGGEAFHAMLSAARADAVNRYQWRGQWERIERAAFGAASGA